ncbi:MAG: CRISPR-associated protein Cas5 [bacterium]|nr:CRISPR-associated protein Cas5 [bacterium]
MDNKWYVSFEVEGPAAMFTRPDTGSAPVSYAGPTFSAAKGMFEAVAHLKSAYIRPTKVEICAPLKFHRYVTNYGGPLRKNSQITGGDSYQLAATILVNVCYRVYGVVEPCGDSPQGNNHLHGLQEIFTRRLQKGQCFYPPCLGWKEFVPSYFGPFRDGTEVDRSVNLTIPSMLHSAFDSPTRGKRAANYRQAVEIRQGVLEYA